MSEQKNNKRIVFQEIAKIIFGILFVVFACLFGGSLRDVAFRATLLDLDKKQKADATYYTHVVVNDINGDNDYSSKYKHLLNYQKTSYSLGNLFQSYLVTYDSALEELDRDKLSLNYVGESTSLLTTWNEAALATLSVFSDKQTMESISLFLYKNLGTNISGKYGAKCGAYISSEVADLLISEVDSLNTYDDILNNKIIINATNERIHYTTTYSINNIYITDSEFDFQDETILEEFRKFNSSNRNYLDFFNQFAMNPIITYDSTSFSNRECALCYDVADKLGNMEYFVDRVIGKDYVSNGLVITIYANSGYIYDNTFLLNSLSQKYKNKSLLTVGYIYLILLLASFAAVIFLTIKTTLRCDNFKKTYLLLLSSFGPQILFLICSQIALGIFGRTYRCLMIFNSWANISCLLCVGIILLIPLFLLRKKKL